MKRSSMVPMAVFAGVLGFAACGGGDQAGGAGEDAGFETTDPAAGGLNGGVGAGGAGTGATPGMGATGADSMTAGGTGAMPMDSSQRTPSSPQ